MKRMIGFALMGVVCTAQMAFADSDWVVGKEWVATVEKGYQEGACADLLTKIERWLAECKIPPFKKPKVQIVESDETQEQWSALSEERMERLLKIAEEAPPSLIRDVIFAVYGEEEEGESLAIHPIHASFPLATPFALEVDALLKDEMMKEDFLLFKMAIDQGVTEEEREALHFIIKLQKIGALEALSLEKATVDEVDRQIVRLICNTRRAFERQAALSHDMTYLDDLENGRREPVDAIERRVVQVLQEYGEKMQLLTQKQMEKWQSTIPAR